MCLINLIDYKFIYNQQTIIRMGKKIENYVLDNMIGQGQFGKVYKAINQKTSQVVAIKIIKVQKFKMSPKLEQFTINQIQTLSKIQDTTHVVRFIQILKTANNYYFVYQFCNGGTLEQEIKNQGRFSQQKGLNYFKDLLKAFKILIKSNIMHRDIKPSNILLHNGIIKLADFGFCKPLKDARDLSQTMLGSPIYMAPEILKGEVYTMKADIWSLGVVLYEMIYGFCPFEEKTIARLISLIDQSTVVFPVNVKVTKKTEDLLKRMLVKDHFKRIEWEQLFNYDYSIQLQQQRPRMSSANPFTKKATFTSIITQQVRNRYLTPIQTYKNHDNYKQTSNQLTSTNNSNSTNNFSSNKDIAMKKKQSTHSISLSDKKLIQICLQSRSKIHHGLKLLKGIIHQGSSKLVITICSMLSRKIRSFNKGNNENLKKIPTGQQNKQKINELKKLLIILTEEKNKVQQKLSAFEPQYQQIKQPHDILFLKFAEEEGLTQQKQGLLQLVQIYDYLNDIKSIDYSRLSKKQLLQEYQKRIFKKA